MTKLYLGIHLNDNHFNSIMNALKLTKKIGGNVLQIYGGSKYLTTLREKIRLTKEEINEIKIFLKKYNIKLFIHAILRLNYCNDPFLKRNEWGIDNLVYDLGLCYKLNGSGVIIHLGTHKTKKIDIIYDECLINFINSLKMALDKTKKVPILLETPVNRKNIVGGTIERLSKLYNNIPEEYIKRVKICIDTQHIFASGYNLRNATVTKDYFEKVDKLIGIKNVILIHLNDSKKEFNSKINRHSPIGQGYIFSEDKESLAYIINFANKNNISILLETSYENYVSELKYLQSLKEVDGGGSDIKKIILKIFKEMLVYHETLGSKKNSITKFRVDSYKKAIKTIENYNKPIYDCNDVKHLPNIGKGFCEKINIISEKGTLNIYENIIKNDKMKSVKIFQKIFGIGPKYIENIIKKNIFTINELKDAIKNDKIKLTEKQLIGLTYYDDLNKKIPRNEIYNYTEIIKNMIKNKDIEIYNAGSYRLGKKESGDIDIIVTYNATNSEETKIYFEKIMKENNIIVETLSNGKEKCIYIIKLDYYKYYRKMDVAFVDKENLIWYLLYFGSGRDFSKKIRGIFSKNGYKLNEKGLFDKKTGVKIDFNPNSEKDIFDYIGIDYIIPENR